MPEVKRENGKGTQFQQPTPSTSPLNRMPPCSIPAEECLLGCILLKPDVCDDVATILSKEDFFDQANRTLFGHIMSLHERGRRVDLTLLVEHLKQFKDLETVGGMVALGRMANSVPHAAFAQDYARTIRELALRRRLIDACTESLLESYDSEDQASQLLERAENRVFSIVEDQREGTVRELRDVIDEALDRLDARLKGEHADEGTETGFADLDNITAGLHRSELTILAARPSMGKTAFALNIAEHVAIQCRVPVLFISLEMSRVELSDRLLCSRARVDSNHLRRGILQAKEQKRIVDISGKIRERPLYIDDSPTRTVTEIGAATRRTMRAEKGRLGLVIIDYLQLIEADNPRDPRQEQVARMARRLKIMARDLKVPVLCLAQLNRQAEMTKDNRPKLSHLRESGAIEQDADTVMFIHREEYYLTGDEKSQHEGQATVIVAKQRNGPTGDVQLFFHNRYARFENAETRAREPDYDAFGPDEPGSPF
jgi:replicative DNA helicase